MNNTRIFSAPTVINLEITDLCNARCRHCYNYWREDHSKSNSLTKERFDELVEIFSEAGVFHVVLTGGEPFVKMDLLEYGFQRLRENNISFSCNSNLMMATEENLNRLKAAGVDHILTSLNSHDPATNDYMVNKSGGFDEIVSGIRLAVSLGIRISVNMIVSQRNKSHVYETGKLVHELGAQKLFGTRVVPSVNVGDVNDSDFTLSKEEARDVLDQLYRVKRDTGIMIGTLVSYPLCLLGDLDKYRDFVGRGCPAQSGHIMSINADGETHACVHQEQGYGNIFDIGIREAYRNMREWHEGAYRHAECAGCDYLEICSTGCRMSAHAYYGEQNAADQLMVDKEAIHTHYNIIEDDEVFGAIESGMRFTVPGRLRFRREDGFYLVNIRWANTISCPTPIAEFLIERQKSGVPFTLTDFCDDRNWLARLFFKDVVESDTDAYDQLKKRVGLSVDLGVLG